MLVKGIRVEFFRQHFLCLLLTGIKPKNNFHKFLQSSFAISYSFPNIVILTSTHQGKALYVGTNEEVYGNYQRSEMYAMLYGVSTIYSHPDLCDKKKLELLVLLKWHWSFLKNIYSVVFRCIVGHRLTNMAQVANTVTLSKENQPFLHLFYGALKGNIDHFCVKKGDRDKLESLLQKIEDMMKSGVPSDKLDELYGILFPEEYQDYVEKHRPKNYNQLEAEYESFKQEMDERMQPVGLSNAEKGILAFELARRLDIQNQWQVFATLWGTTSGTLRSAYNKANDQRKTLKFIERLKNALC